MSMFRVGDRVVGYFAEVPYAGTIEKSNPLQATVRFDDGDVFSMNRSELHHDVKEGGRVTIEFEHGNFNGTIVKLAGKMATVELDEGEKHDISLFELRPCAPEPRVPASPTGAHIAAGHGKVDRFLFRILISIVGVIFVIVSALVLFFGDPKPPSSVVLSTGVKDGGYWDFGENLKVDVESHDKGTRVVLVESRGSIQNYKRLMMSRDEPDAVDVAFVQGGTAQAGIGADLDLTPIRAIASLYSEPLWLFYRHDKKLDLLADFAVKKAGGAKWRIYVGPMGSGTKIVVEGLLAEVGVVNGVNAELLTDHHIAEMWKNHKEAGIANDEVGALLRLNDKLDAVFMITAPSSRKVARLLEDVAAEGGVQLMSFERHEALTKKMPFLTQIKLARGVVDLKKGLPAKDYKLLAPQAVLVCRAELHPHIVTLLYKAAVRTFSSGNAVDGAGTYPNVNFSELHVHETASEYVKYGEGWMQRNLPYWLRRLIKNLLLLAIPIVTILLPAIKLVPALINLRVSMIVSRHYKALREIESEAIMAKTPEEFDAGLSKIETLHNELWQISDSFHGDHQIALYHWRQHLYLVQVSLRERRDRLRNADMNQIEKGE
jgi:TRAP-type uncharacterized transport system substrate-binding protein